MATIDLITYDQKMVTPKDDALIHQFGISNGVLYGCEVTLANSNTLHITGGQGVIYGRQWEIAEGDITVTLPASGSLKGRLYVKIDLSNTTNPIELLVQTAVTLPDLTDDDQINVDNSVSELEICTFDVSSLTISNLERTVEQVADGDHQDVVDLQADVSEIKSNLTDNPTDSTNYDISIDRVGKQRLLTFFRASWGNLKSFINDLPSTDNPRGNRVYSNAVYKSYYSDNIQKYIGVGFIIIRMNNGVRETTAITSTAYNSSSASETVVGDTNQITGQLIWFVD